MWFDPTTLLTEELLPPANLASSANLSACTQPKAPVVSKISEISNPVKAAEGITPNHTQKIVAWLAHIGEADQEMVDDLLVQVTNDARAMAYFLKRSEEVKTSETTIVLIQCGTCQHFKPHHQHGKGTGSCERRVKPPGVCFWGESETDCKLHTEVKP